MELGGVARLGGCWSEGGSGIAGGLTAGEGYGEGNKCCETEERSSSASGYQEGETDDEAMGTIERPGVPGAAGGGSSEVEGAAEASEKCGNKEGEAFSVVSRDGDAGPIQTLDCG